MATSLSAPALQQLLATKLHTPAGRPDLVLRPHLFEQLDEGLHRQLTLLSAPAGSGKTTLLSTWVRRLQRRADWDHHPQGCVAWLSLDDNDRDPTRFLTYVCLALRRCDVAAADRALGALQSSQLPLYEAILIDLINEIGGTPERIVFVLDDYHLVAASAVHTLLAFLVKNQPPHLHLIIATRVDPQLPLAGLRVRNQLTELRTADLRFSSAEAGDFLTRVMGLDLPTDQIALLESRTEGWIAGLQLAALSLQGHTKADDLIGSFGGSHRFVLDYLIDEVLGQQPESIQDFLLDTSVLHRLTASLCDSVTGRNDGQAMLERLERSNLFIAPLDDERRWYRYHRLFVELLRQRLDQTRPERATALHRRASLWYAEQGLVDDAIEHALHGADFERAAGLIEAHFSANFERASLTSLQRWLADMPRDFVAADPRLCILDAWTQFNHGQLDRAERALRTADKLLDFHASQTRDAAPVDKPMSAVTRRKLAGRIAAMRSFLASYAADMPKTIEHARAALANLPEAELGWRTAALIALGDAYARLGDMAAARDARTAALAAGRASGDAAILILANLRLAEILRQEGKLQQVVSICARAWRRASESDMAQSPMAGWLLAIWGEALAEQNDLEQALHRVKQGVARTARSGDVPFIVWSNLCLVRVLFSRGELSAAEEVIQSLQDLARERDVPLDALCQFAAWRMRLWLVQNRLAAASQYAMERRLAPAADLDYPRESEHIALARLLIAQGKLDDAAALILALRNAAVAGGRNSPLLELLLLDAQVSHARGEADRAMSALKQALTLAEAGGFVRTIVDEGPPAVALLRAALARGMAPAYIRRLLRVFPPHLTKKTADRTPPHRSTDWVESLSARELEVLQLIAAGLTNQEIADRLVLSRNTVKVHTRNIYAKLDAHHRTMAVAKARAAGIL